MWELLFGSTARNRIDETLEYNRRPLWSSMPQGWECPKCGSVYAPHVSKCSQCHHGSKNVETAPTTGASTTTYTAPTNVRDVKYSDT